MAIPLGWLRLVPRPICDVYLSAVVTLTHSTPRTIAASRAENATTLAWQHRTAPSAAIHSAMACAGATDRGRAHVSASQPAAVTSCAMVAPSGRPSRPRTSAVLLGRLLGLVFVCLVMGGSPCRSSTLLLPQPKALSIESVRASAHHIGSAFDDSTNARSAGEVEWKV